MTLTISHWGLASVTPAATSGDTPFTAGKYLQKGCVKAVWGLETEFWVAASTNAAMFRKKKGGILPVFAKRDDGTGRAPPTSATGSQPVVLSGAVSSPFAGGGQAHGTQGVSQQAVQQNVQSTPPTGTHLLPPGLAAAVESNSMVESSVAATPSAGAIGAAMTPIASAVQMRPIGGGIWTPSSRSMTNIGRVSAMGTPQMQMQPGPQRMGVNTSGQNASQAQAQAQPSAAPEETGYESGLTPLAGEAHNLPAGILERGGQGVKRVWAYESPVSSAAPPFSDAKTSLPASRSVPTIGAASAPADVVSTGSYPPPLQGPSFFQQVQDRYRGRLSLHAASYRFPWPLFQDARIASCVARPPARPVVCGRERVPRAGVLPAVEEIVGCVDDGACPFYMLRTTMSHISIKKDVTDLVDVPLGVIAQPLAPHRLRFLGIPVRKSLESKKGLDTVTGDDGKERKGTADTQQVSAFWDDAKGVTGPPEATSLSTLPENVSGQRVSPLGLVQGDADGVTGGSNLPCDANATAVRCQRCFGFFSPMCVARPDKSWACALCGFANGAPANMSVYQRVFGATSFDVSGVDTYKSSTVGKRARYVFVIDTSRLAVIEDFVRRCAMAIRDALVSIPAGVEVAFLTYTCHQSLRFWRINGTRKQLAELAAAQYDEYRHHGGATGLRKEASSADLVAAKEVEMDVYSELSNIAKREILYSEEGDAFFDSLDSSRTLRGLAVPDCTASLLVGHEVDDLPCPAGDLFVDARDEAIAGFLENWQFLVDCAFLAEGDGVDLYAAVKASGQLVEGHPGRVMVLQREKTIDRRITKGRVGSIVLERGHERCRTAETIGRVLKPCSDEYEELAIDLRRKSVSVDLFLAAGSYVDVATIGVLPEVTGGRLQYFKVYVGAVDGHFLGTCLHACVAEERLYDVTMKMRCSQGLSVDTYLVHKSNEVGDTLHYGSVSPTLSIGIMVASDYDRKGFLRVGDPPLPKGVIGALQFVVLGTTYDGRRMLRIYNTPLAQAKHVVSLYNGISCNALVTLIAKDTAYRLLRGERLDVAQAVLPDILSKICVGFRRIVGSAISHNLLLPVHLLPLIVYVLGLTKSPVVWEGVPFPYDERASRRIALMYHPVARVLAQCYPRIYELFPSHMLVGAAVAPSSCDDAAPEHSVGDFVPWALSDAALMDRTSGPAAAPAVNGADTSAAVEAAGLSVNGLAGGRAMRVVRDWTRRELEDLKRTRTSPGAVVLPVCVPARKSNVSSDGVYIFDVGVSIYIWIGASVDDDVIYELFGHRGGQATLIESDVVYDLGRDLVRLTSRRVRRARAPLSGRMRLLTVLFEISRRFEYMHADVFGTRIRVVKQTQRDQPLLTKYFVENAVVNSRPGKEFLSRLQQRVCDAVGVSPESGKPIDMGNGEATPNYSTCSDACPAMIRGHEAELTYGSSPPTTAGGEVMGHVQVDCGVEGGAALFCNARSMRTAGEGTPLPAAEGECVTRLFSLQTLVSPHQGRMQVTEQQQPVKQQQHVQQHQVQPRSEAPAYHGAPVQQQQQQPQAVPMMVQTPDPNAPAMMGISSAHQLPERAVQPNQEPYGTVHTMSAGGAMPLPPRRGSHGYHDREGKGPDIDLV